MNVIDMPIAELAPAPYNPRKDLKAGDREYESLKRSIEEFGVVDPVIFNTRTKRVVGVHQRLTVLRDLGHTTAPTVLVELDEQREKALNLALNKIAGSWDMPMLKDLLLDIERSGGDQTLTGFDPKEIEEIITTYRDDDPGEDIPVPEPPADPVSRAGDRYEVTRGTAAPGSCSWARRRPTACGPTRRTASTSRCATAAAPPSTAGKAGTGPPAWTPSRATSSRTLHPCYARSSRTPTATCGPVRPGTSLDRTGGVQHEIFIEAVLAAGWHHAQTLVCESHPLRRVLALTARPWYKVNC